MYTVYKYILIKNRWERKKCMKKLLSIITAMVMIFCLMPPPITAEAALSITYREYAADGSYTEKTLQESEYLNCTDLDVLKDNTYFYSTSYTPNKLTIKGDVNLILPVGSVFEVKQYITIEQDATLNIYGAGTLITGQFNIFNNDGNVNLHGANVISLYDINVSSLTVNAGKVSAMVNGIFCTNLAVNGGTVEAESSYSPAIYVNGTFTVGKNGSVSGYSSNDVAFSKVPTVNNRDDIIVSYGDSKSSYSSSTTKPIDDDLISRHYVSIEKGKKSVDYIKREYADDTGVTDTPTSAPAVRSISSFSQPSALSGWYYVDGNVDLNYRPVISQNACIILTDGSTLNANCGIELPEGCTLEIYGQENGTGTIKSSLTDIAGDAFIGGDLGQKCGTLKLFGGNIKIDYNSKYNNDLIGNGAGIAIGDGAVYVYGGSIDAKAVQAIITTKLNIYGGSVTAFSYNDKAMYSVPAFGTGYIPTVKYGGSAESAKNATSPTDSSVYTSNKYVSIEKANITADYEYYEYAWNGSESVGSLKTAACTTLDDSYFPTALSDGWYAVKGDVTISDRIKISGEVNLILTDGFTLNVKRGINLPENSTLSIYGQSGGTGKLNAESGNKTAIGGEDEESCGTLNVYGGQVSAESSGTAIGGGKSAIKTAGNGGTVNVYGGQVSAESQGTAIGGGGSTDGTGGNGGTVNVYGGTVNAISDSETAIGGGFSTSGTGGTGSDLTVYGGKVSAKSSSFTAIGGGRTTSGTVGNSGQTFISGGSVSAYSKQRIAFDHAPTYGTNYVPKVSYGESDTSTVTKINPEDSVYTSNKYVLIEKADLTADYQYCSRSWNGSSVVSSIETANCTTLDNTNFPTALSDGWYAVKGDVTVSDRIKISGDVQLILTDGCTLNAKNGINLPESSTLSIYGQSGGTGKLNAEYDGDTAIGGEYGESCGTLNVYGGTVNANSTNEAAIGGGDSIDGTSGNGGTVNVYGGTVNAVSDSGAAIGGGDSATGTGGNGGTVNVYGGKLTAGSSNSVAIGGGSSATGPAGNGGTVNVYGGTVDANSANDTAIGGGCSARGTGGNGGTVNVYGGKLNAVSSSRAAIGGGLGANRTPGSVGQTFISGGSVSAYSRRDNVAAFDHAPTYGTNYIPKVTYGESDTSTVSKINPEDSVYTSNKYVLIEKSNDDHEHCDHSANTNPTCEGANCSVCGTYIAPTGHKNGDPVTENRTFASCTEGGSYDEVVYCSVCGKEMSRETKAIEPSEHTAGKPVIENEAADGSYDEVVYCSVCNAEMSRERKVRAEHKHIEGMADVITMPTFTSAGSRVFRCTLCGEILRSEAIPPITMDFPTNTVSSGNASQVIYTEFPELKFTVEIRDGIAVISWDKVETADRYVIYAIKDGKISEIAKIRKTSFETGHQSGTDYFVRYMKNGVLSPRSKSINEDITSDKPIVSASAGKDFIRLDWQDMGAEKYNIYKYADGKAIKIGEVKKTAVKIINLSPDTEYKFIVTAVIDGKETTMLMRDILTVRTKKA